MIDIYDYNGVKLTYSSVLSDLPITEACEHVEELMKSDYVALSWKDSECYTLPVGAYIEYEGTAYHLLEPYNPEQNSEDEYEYKPQFQHPKMYLGKVPFSRPTKDSDANDIDLIEWPYTGSISTLLEYFREAIENALGFEPNTFMYEIVGEIDDVVSTTFSKIDILSALSNVANVLSCEWHIDLEQMTLYFGHIMIDHSEVEDTVLEVGRNIGIPSVRSSKEGFWNAFEPQGSTRNITRRAASGEYVQANVRLALDRETYYHLNDEDYPDGVLTPEGVIYTDENGRVVDRLPSNQKAYIKTLIFEDIFPKLDLYAYDVRCRERYLLDDREQRVIDHYEGTTPIYKRYAVWYMRLAYPLYNPDKSVREWVDYNIKDVRDLTSTVVSIGTNHSDYTSFVLDMAFSSHYFNNRSVSYPGSEEYPNYIVRIQAHDITIKGYITKDANTGKCSFYSESSDPQGDDRDEPDAAALRAFSDAIEQGDEILFVSGINSSAFPSKYSQIIDGKELYCQFAVNKKSGAETTPLAGRGNGDDGNYGFALDYQEDDETIPPVESDGDTGVEIKKGDYRIVFQQQNDYILPTTYAQGLIPKGVKVNGHEVTNLNDLSDKSDGLKGNIVNLYNIVMDSTYEASAQNDLANETLKYIKNLFTDNNSYTFKTDEVAFKKAMDIHLAPSLYIGKRVIYKNGSYELTTRVMKIVTKLDYAFQKEITVGNEVIKGAQTQLKEQVQTLISAGASGDGSGQVSEAAIKKVINNYVAARFISKIDDDTAKGNISFEKNINVGGRETVNEIQSTEYTGDGLLDTGYRLWYEEGRAKLVIDDLVARGKFTANELETRIWTYAGGNMVFSGAGSTLFFVEYLDGNENPLGYTYINQPWLLRGRALLAGGLAWSKRKAIQRELTEAEKSQVVKFRCYEYSDDGTMQTRNWWKPNDIAMCETLNKVRSKANSDGSYSGSASNTVYKRRIAGIGSKEIPMLNDGRVYDYVDLWNIYDLAGNSCKYKGTDGQEHLITDSVKGYDSSYHDWPAAGDVIVQMGNPLDTDRQSAVTIEVQGDVHGFKVYDTINDYSMANKEWVEIGYDQTTGKAKANVYGDFRFGCRESEEATGGSYVKYNRTTKQLDIRANVRFTSPTTQQETTLDNFASAVTGDLTNLQNQIDGQIESWFYNYAPVSVDESGAPTSTTPLNVAPYSDWTTDNDKIAHLGDTFTNNSTGYCWRFSRNSTTNAFEWVIIEDSAVITALQNAARAQDTADHKRRVFTTTPFPPYEVGDLWAQGSSGELMRCIYARTATESYTATDWDKASKYTDDTAFNGYINAILNGSGASGDAATAAAAQKAILDAIDGVTVVNGGLILSNMLVLRKYNGSGDVHDVSNYTTWSGISGIYDDSVSPVKGHGLAAWYGGAMVDIEDLTNYWTAQQIAAWEALTPAQKAASALVAKSADRFDGSGYRASGNISWDKDGVVTVKGQTIKTANFYLNDVDITAQLNAILGMFEIETINNVEWVHVKNNRPLYSDSDISAGGAASGGGGGGGGASALYELNDVTPNATHDGVYGAQDGYVLTYDASTTHWYAAPAAQTYVLPQATSGALGGIKIGFTTDSTNKNYAVVLDNDGKAYVNVPWSSGGTQSDWNETNTSSLAYIKNKPTIPTPSSTNTGYAANADNAKNVVSLGNVTTTTSDDRSDYGIYTYNMYNSAGTAPQTYMSAIGFGYGVSKIEIAGSWGDDYTGNIYWRSKSDRDVSQYPWKAWKTIIDSGNIGSQSVNYATSAGNADTLDGYYASSFASSGHNHDGRYLYWGGYAADAVAMTWGTLTAANGYHILSHFSTSDGGDGGFAYKSGQIFMQIDGMFYQREGAYACIDTGGSQTIANNLQVASVKIEETNEINSYTGMLYLNYRVNTGVSLCNGGGNVGIGTTNPSYKLHVSGDVYATGDVTAASDKRKKDFVENVNLTVEQIANAPAVKFRWKDKRDELVHVGTYAQYWQNVLPESVSENNDSLGMNYGSAALVSVVKVAERVLTHEEEIEQLKKWYAESQDEIKAQKQRIRELEHEVERLKIA